ncbi:MAG: thioredoxin domain-containing protein [Patescibacteria group bacterium]
MCYEEVKKMFNSLSPVTSFCLGLVAAVLVLCTIGFFVLVYLLVGGNMRLAGSDNNNKKVVEMPPQNNPGPGNSADQNLTEQAGEVKSLTGRDHVRGDNNAKITLIEYSDYECPFCKRFHQTMKDVLAAYPGQVKWVYRHWPLNFHANAAKESEAAECAYELGGHNKFWEYTDKIYERTTANGTGFALENLPKLAVELGLDETKFEECLKSGKYKAYVDQALAEGSAAGVQGTPGIILIDAKGNKELIKGALPLELMKQVIDKALAR